MFCRVKKQTDLENSLPCTHLYGRENHSSVEEACPGQPVGLPSACPRGTAAGGVWTQTPTNASRSGRQSPRCAGLCAAGRGLRETLGSETWTWSSLQGHSARVGNTSPGTRAWHQHAWVPAPEVLRRTRARLVKGRGGQAAPSQGSPEPRSPAGSRFRCPLNTCLEQPRLAPTTIHAAEGEPGQPPPHGQASKAP